MANLPEFESEADYLFLVGDIGRPGKDSLEKFIENIQMRFKKVFFVPGNHEFYHSEYYNAKERMKAICSKWENFVFFMDKTFHVIDSFRLIGATLWSNVTEEGRSVVVKGLADYTAISIVENGEPKRKITIEDTNKWHAEDVEFIKEQIEIAKNEKQIAIVLTHHAPLMEGTSEPRFKGQLMTQAFSTNLENMMGAPVAVWCFGHTHYSSDQTKNGTRVISNQLGYLMKQERNTGFRKDLVVTVSSDSITTITE